MVTVGVAGGRAAWWEPENTHARQAVLATRRARGAGRRAQTMYLISNIQDPNSFPRPDEYPKGEKGQDAISRTIGQAKRNGGERATDLYSISSKTLIHDRVSQSGRLGGEREAGARTESKTGESERNPNPGID